MIVYRLLTGGIVADGVPQRTLCAEDADDCVDLGEKIVEKTDGETAPAK